MWQVEGLSNESDVEQKFLYPFFADQPPLGLGIPPAVIQSKANIRRFSIGKGAEQKLYFPDYLFVMLGFPIVVVEAKSPTESVAEGYRQASLYAHELNGLFPHGVNPTKFIIASNGVELWYGHADQSEPLRKAEVATLGVYSSEIADLQNLISWKRLEALATSMAESLRGDGFFKPRRLVSGVNAQNEEVGKNTFGATLTADISHIFNPTTVTDRKFIATNGYIASRRRERYLDPIDRVIRAARPVSETDATPLEDSSRPRELLAKMRTPRDLEHKVLLLIGSVGSGKSTFVDYLQEVALPRELIESTVWCRLDMNAAPVSANEIYGWLRQGLIQASRASLPDQDFDSLEVMKKLYSVEINKFSKGVGKLYEKQPLLFDEKLAEHLERVQQDAHAVAVAHIRYTCGDRNRLCIIVLDNCDKKTRDEQLLMFEAAQWLQKEFRALIILPLRDETYDNHRDHPPLDTALKDLVFRIEPPMFQQVLMSRVQLALNDLSRRHGGGKLRFELPNGFTVEYPESDQAFYLASIVRSLFEHDKFVRRMIVGLSGRNMRNALEIFLEFCNSAHIGEDQIFKIRQTEGRHTIPFHQVATVLMRMNRRFYDSDHSYVKNVFAASRDDPRPSYFARYMILRWLREKFSSSGTGGLKGYYTKETVKRELLAYGLSPDVLDREFNYLLDAQCVIAEHLRRDTLADDDLVRLGPAGFVHVELVGNINYLAAVAEDTYFKDRLQAERVMEKIRNPAMHLHVNTALSNATELVSFLKVAKEELLPPNGSFLVDDMLPRLVDLADAEDTLSRVSKSLSGDPWFDASRKFPRGSEHDGIAVNVVDFGCFVEFGTGLIGLVHASKMNGFAVRVGDKLRVKVQWVDEIQRKMGLLLVQIVEEDAGEEVQGASAPR